ncbi:oxygenase MpaB family protein [Salinisphaera sp. SPP-AMP-43]|uniref:oxygenase MpaB family protein n=1 Tax=Salinisphaera sp. SPP-AMP-43 TaxID=3121288 RepID=UPI003C6E2686
MNRVYSRKWGVRHNPAVRQEIDSLDAENDAQRIVHLLAAYEFAWEFNRALEVALFYTYGSEPVSKLLDRTAEFEKHGQKRYDDTALLIGYFIEFGWDGEVGRRAIERMNQTHAHYRIHNDEFLFVLWTFIAFPIRWTERYGRRPMTRHEQQAWFNFWRGIGERMGIQDIPRSKPEYDAWTQRYEARTFVYSEASARVSDATVRIIEGWLPGILRFGVKPIVCCLMPQQFLDAVGYPHPRPWLRHSVEGTLRLVGGVRRIFAIGRYPGETAKRKQRTYPSGYAIEEMAPVNLSTRVPRRGATAAGRSRPENSSR